MLKFLKILAVIRSILESYYSDSSEDNNVDLRNTPIVESNESFISINTILDDTRDLTGTNEIVDLKDDEVEKIKINKNLRGKKSYWGAIYKDKTTIVGDNILGRMYTFLANNIDKIDLSTYKTHYKTLYSQYLEEQEIHTRSRFFIHSICPRVIFTLIAITTPHQPQP